MRTIIQRLFTVFIWHPLYNAVFGIYAVLPYDYNDDDLSIFRRRKVGFIFQFFNLIPVLDVAEKLCNKIAIIKNGKLMASGDIEAVRGDESLRRSTFAVVDAAFGQRRKMLRGALSSLFGSSESASAALERAGVDPQARGEALTLESFIAIAEQLEEHRAEDDT